MPLNTPTNYIEPADAREALLRYYLAKKSKTTQSKAKPNNIVPSSNSKSKSPSLRSSASSSSVSSGVFSSCSSLYSPDTSPYSSPRLSAVDDLEEESLVEGAEGAEMYVSTINEEKDVLELSVYEYAPTRPSYIEYSVLWLGVEADVDYVFHSWESGLGYVPEEFVHDAVRAFEAGGALAIMDSELRAGLIHIISVAMMNGRLRPISSTPGQVEYFLLEKYGKVKNELGNSWIKRPKREHWLCGTLRDRASELRWLKYQAERRCWVCQKRKMLASCQEQIGPSEKELQDLFDTYIQL